MKIRLPLCDEPPMIAYHFIALPLSIIFTRPEQYKTWFYNEFTQVYANKSERPYALHISLYSSTSDNNEYAPLASIQIPYMQLDLGGDYAAFYRLLVKNGYYVRTFCNVRYLSALNINYDFFHDFMIFGFDDDKGIFDIRAYKDGKLQDVCVSYDEINNGHIYCDKPENPHKHIIIYKLQDIQCETTIDTLSWHLVDYLFGIDTQLRIRAINPGFNSGIWGMKVYDQINALFEQFDYQRTGIAIPSWCAFFEHKQHMQNKLRYFKKQGLIEYPDSLDQQMKSICGNANLCIMLQTKIDVMAKMEVSDRSREVLSIQRIIRQLKAQETETYGKLCRINGWYVP